MASKIEHREDNEQEALISWAHVANVNGVKPSDHLIAIPNARKTTLFAGGKLKKQGVKAGVSDLQLCYPMPLYHGLWIELKAPKTKTKPAGKASVEQLAWLESRKALGYATALCFGWEPAMKVIIAYLKGEQI